MSLQLKFDYANYYYVKIIQWDIILNIEVILSTNITDIDIAT